MLRDKRAVSPVVGVILMVAITIVLAATIYIWITSMQPKQEASPAISLTVSVIEADGHKALRISVNSAPQNIRWDKFELMVGEDRISCSAVGGTVKAGDTFYVYNDGHTLKIGETLDEVEKHIRKDIGTGDITVKLIDTQSNTVIYQTVVSLS